MKLNLLPTTVSKETQGRGAWVVFAILTILGVIIAALLQVTSQNELNQAKQEESEARAKAEQAKSESSQADAIMASVGAIAIERNLKLASAMKAHSTVYPDLYDEVRRYIPPFFRVTQMSAAPAADGSSSTVTLTGVISSYQQYADLMLALLRIPQATNVSRSGYQLADPIVPSLNEVDQTGRPIKPGETNVPQDPLQRLDYYKAQGVQTGYLGVGNFGGDPSLTRGAMPNASLITVQVTIPNRIMTPDPRATLSATGVSAGAAGAPSGPPTGTTSPGRGATSLD